MDVIITVLIIITMIGCIVPLVTHVESLDPVTFCSQDFFVVDLDLAAIVNINDLHARTVVEYGRQPLIGELNIGDLKTLQLYQRRLLHHLDEYFVSDVVAVFEAKTLQRGRPI